MAYMTDTNDSPRGPRAERLPIRLPRTKPRRPEPATKLGRMETEGVASVLPTRVRVEVGGISHGTAAALRAQRVLREIEETGGVGAVTEVAGDRSEVVAELDGAQAVSLARYPFVRRIVSLS